MHGLRKLSQVKGSLRRNLGVQIVVLHVVGSSAILVCFVLCAGSNVDVEHCVAKFAINCVKCAVAVEDVPKSATGCSVSLPVDAWSTALHSALDAVMHVLVVIVAELVQKVVPT